MQFPIQDHYIHMSRHRNLQLHLNVPLFCVCSYVCNDLEWETAYEQAPKNGFQQNISQGRERERKLHNVKFLRESNGSNGFSHTKIAWPLLREAYIISLHIGRP